MELLVREWLPVADAAARVAVAVGEVDAWVEAGEVVSDADGRVDVRQVFLDAAADAGWP